MTTIAAPTTETSRQKASSMLKTVLRGASRALALPLLVASAHPAGATTLGVSMVPPVAFFHFLQEAIQAEADAHPGTTVSFGFSKDGDVDAQLAQVRDYLAQKVDGLVILPVSPAAGTRIAEMARAADVPLVFVNNGPREDYFPGRVALALPNDLVAGKLQMLKLATMMGGRGNIAIVRGPSSHAASQLRTQGVKETLVSFPDIHVVEEDAADWDRDRAETMVAGWLARDHIDAIAANNDEMAIGAANAIAKSGHHGIMVAGVDGTPDGLAAMRSHGVTLTVFQDPKKEGGQAVDDVLALIAHESVPQYDWISFSLVTDHTLSQF